MVKKIMRDPLFLGQKSEDATEKDKQVVTDLWRACTRYEEDRNGGIHFEKLL